MFKKFLCIIIAFALCTSQVFAQVTANPTDVENDIVSISATGFPGESVSIMVTNPGYTKEDALSGSDGAIQYFNSYTPASSDFTVPIKIMGNAGGTFNVYILSRDGEKTGSFEFYNSVFKQKCIDDINSATAGTDITTYFENLINAYGMSGDSMYSALGSDKVSEAFLLLRDTRPDKKLPDDIAEVFDMINDSFILAVFNNGREDLAFSDGALLHSDVLNLDGTDEFEDYNSSISADGISYINQKLLSGGYKDITEIKDRFNELVYRGVLINYKERGYGHIHAYFAKYKSAYEDAGFDIPSKENQSKYLKLLEFTDESLSDIASKFNSVKEESAGSKPSSGGNSGGSVGGSFTTGGGTSYVDPNPAPALPDVPSQNTFTDVDESHWAKNAIDALSGKGWINGYEDGSFRPDSLITRAEFAKLILTVFDIEAGGAADFADVESSAWYAPYVAKAQAEGIIKGDGLYFFPQSSLTRQDAAVIICRITGQTSEQELSFADSPEVAQYAAPSVAYLVSQGVINGYGDNTFRPGGSITRAEIAKIIYTLLEKGGITK